MPGTATISWDSYVVDTDAQTFLTAASITDVTITNAIDFIVRRAKTNGWWTICVGIWPFVGGTSTTNAINLKSPGTFNLTFGGGWTHSSTGSLPNGTTGFANTGVIPNTSLSLNNSHLSVYSRTSTTGTGSKNEFGCVDNTGTFLPNIYLATYFNDGADNMFGGCIGDYNNSGGGVSTASPVQSSTGLSIISRVSSTDLRIYRKGGLDVTNTNTQSQVSLPTTALYLSASNFNGTASNFSDREQAFATAGSGVSGAIAALMYTDIQAFQQILSRQV